MAPWLYSYYVMITAATIFMKYYLLRESPDENRILVFSSEEGIKQKKKQILCVSQIGIKRKT